MQRKWSILSVVVAIPIFLLSLFALGFLPCNSGSAKIDNEVKLKNITMLEAIEILRERGVYLHFEREELDKNNSDYSRPVVDSKRRFNVSFSWRMPVEQILTAITQAEGHYSWEKLAVAKEVYWIFPQTRSRERHAASILKWRIPSVSVKGKSLEETVNKELSLSDHRIQVFDRAGFLARSGKITAADIKGLPVYLALAKLFARSGHKLTWTLGGLGKQRVLSISSLPD